MKIMQETEFISVPQIKRSSPMPEVTEGAATEYLRRWLEQAWQEAEHEVRKQAEASPRVSERARFSLD